MHEKIDCPICNMGVLVKKDGTLRLHREFPGGHHKPVCRGSGKSEEEARLWAQGA